MSTSTWEQTLAFKLYRNNNLTFTVIKIDIDWWVFFNFDNIIWLLSPCSIFNYQKSGAMFWRRTQAPNILIHFNAFFFSCLENFKTKGNKMSQHIEMPHCAFKLLTPNGGSQQTNVHTNNTIWRVCKASDCQFHAGVNFFLSPRRDLQKPSRRDNASPVIRQCSKLSSKIYFCLVVTRSTKTRTDLQK